MIDQNLDFAYIYFKFYAPEVKPLYALSNWKKPKDWKQGSTLYIRPFYDNKDKKHIIDQVYLPGPYNTIFTQFWKL